MNKKFGLGKGLGALIPEEFSNDISNEFVTTNQGAALISINLIRPNELQPRKNFDEDKILQLSESIKEHGIIQPIVLKKTENNYIIVAGERRWRAAKAAGLKEVPAIVMELTDKQVLEISLIENIQRQDLNPIEEAIAYKRLLDEFSFTQEELSKRIGKSRTAITNTLRLINLDKRVQEYVIDCVITEGHGRALLGISDPDLQYSTAQKIIDENLSVRETEKLVNKLNSKAKEVEVKVENTDTYINDIRNKLEERFDTKIVVSNKNNKGKIEIEYYSNDDLERILNLMNI
ncbi:MAG: ParB/RepB/Spo0J family partition protein [Solirubrobacterales bacterium]